MSIKKNKNIYNVYQSVSLVFLCDGKCADYCWMNDQFPVHFRPASFSALLLFAYGLIGFSNDLAHISVNFYMCRGQIHSSRPISRSKLH